MPDKTREYLSLVVCGHILQTRFYEVPLLVGKNTLKPLYKRHNQPHERTEEYIKRRVQRQKSSLLLLISANFRPGNKFITFTFDPSWHKDVTDFSYCWAFMRSFIKNRLKEKYPNVKYICIIEAHKSGAYHFHMVTDIPRIPNKDLANLWNGGFVKINEIKPNDRIAAYLSKYLQKSLSDGARRIIRSRNLKLPQRFYGSQLESMPDILNLPQTTRYTSTYTTPRNGQVTFTETEINKK